MKSNRSSWPYILLFVLILMLIFFSGVKYGKKIEEVNKVVRIMMSITPTPSPVPPTTQPTDVPIAFETFSSDLCGVSFLYPNTLTRVKNTDVPFGTFEFRDSSNNPAIRIWCTPQNSAIAFFPIPFEPLDESPFATGSARIANQTVRTTTLQNKKATTFVLKHPQVRNVGVLVDNNLLPLIEQSLKFIKTNPVGSSNSQ